jgi:antitoxin component of MazEF toxin-antitoxin module
MTTTINRWGTSYGIRIPKTILDKFPLGDKQKLDIEVKNDKIILTRSKMPHKSLAEYLNEFGWDGKTPELTDEDREWLDLSPVGEEVQW